MADAAVAGCAVIGAPDLQRGQVVKALVKLRAGYTPSATMLTRLQERVRSKVGAHAYPRQIEFVDDFPLTVTGKIKRKELRERDLARHSSKG